MKRGAVLHSISDDLERVPVRQSLEAEALVWFSNSKNPHAISVRNISAGGMMAICDVPVVIGDSVIAKIDAFGEVTGRVVWAVSSRIGISFDTPLDI